MSWYSSRSMYSSVALDSFSRLVSTQLRCKWLVSWTGSQRQLETNADHIAAYCGIGHISLYGLIRLAKGVIWVHMNTDWYILMQIKCFLWYFGKLLMQRSALHNWLSLQLNLWNNVPVTGNPCPVTQTSKQNLGGSFKSQEIDLQTVMPLGKSPWKQAAIGKKETNYWQWPTALSQM